MKKAKIAVLVSGGGTNLQALIDAEKAGIITSGTISLVISSNPDAFALERASKANIKTAIAHKKSFATREEFEQKIISFLEEENIDRISAKIDKCFLR